MTHSTSALRTGLQPGQALRLHLDRRSTLVVVKGVVMVVAPPLWLGERMLDGQTRLHEGEALSPSMDGWTELIAVGEAPIELVRYGQAGATRKTPWRRLATALFQLSQRLRALRGVS